MSATVVGATTLTARRGSLATACEECGCDVEVAPELVAVVERGAAVRCVRCAAEQVASSATLPALGLTPEAARRLAKRRRRYARRHGIPIEAVSTWPPLELQHAAEARSRRN